MQDTGLRLVAYYTSMITRRVDIRVLVGMIDVSYGVGGTPFDIGTLKIKKRVRTSKNVYG